MKRIVFLFFAVLCTSPLFSQEWEINTSEFGDFCKLYNCAKNENGDLIWTGLCGADFYHTIGCAVKVDNNGNMEFKQLGRDTLYSSFSNIVRLNNGNFFLNGIHKKSKDEPGNPWFLIIDDNLNILFEKYIDIMDVGYEKYYGGPSAVDDDGNVFITGYVVYHDNEGKLKMSALLYKFDEECNEIQHKLVYSDDPNCHVSEFSYMESLQVLNVPGNSEMLVLGAGIGNQPSMIFFDQDLNYLRDFMLYEDIEFQPFNYYSDLWLENGNLILYATGCDDYYDYVKISNINLEAEPQCTLNIKADSIHLTSAIGAEAIASIDDELSYFVYCEMPSITGPFKTHICVIDSQMNVIAQKVIPELDGTNFFESVTTTKDYGCLIDMTYYNPTYMYKSSRLTKFPITDFIPDWSLKEDGTDGVKAEVYPNPATNTLHLNNDEDATLSIMDIQGRKLLQKNVSEGDNEIDISSLNSGMYIYEISGNNFGNKIDKFIKK